MQETTKVNYIQYGKLTKSKKKKPQSSAGATSQSSVSTPSVLLKADTGADVNLINRKTFDQLFDSKVLKPTPSVWRTMEIQQ